MFRDAPARPSYDEIAISRAETEDVPVQVMLDDGLFHREMDYKTTACDKPIPALGQWRRNNKYDGKLCEDGCWSRAEIRRAEEANATERALESGEMVAQSQDLPEPIRPVRKR